MTTYTIISNDKILRRVKCSADNLPHQLAAGETAIEGIFTQKSHKVVGGVLVELSPAEIDALPARHALVEKTNRELILYIVQQLEMAGFTIQLNVDVIKTKNDADKAIDLAAGRARFRAVSSGTLINDEYQLTISQLTQWRNAASPSNAVPATIQSWATATNNTAEQAAQDIEASAAAYEAKLTTIRNLRLNGKAAVAAASSDFVAVANTYIDQLNAI